MNQPSLEDRLKALQDNLLKECSSDDYDPELADCIKEEIAWLREQIKIEKADSGELVGQSR